jgi:hypothetical protein
MKKVLHPFRTCNDQAALRELFVEAVAHDFIRRKDHSAA